MKTTNITLADQYVDITLSEIYIRKAVRLMLKCAANSDAEGMEYWHQRIHTIVTDETEKRNTLRLKQTAIMKGV